MQDKLPSEMEAAGREEACGQAAKAPLHIEEEGESNRGSIYGTEAIRVLNLPMYEINRYLV